MPPFQSLVLPSRQRFHLIGKYTAYRYLYAVSPLSLPPRPAPLNLAIIQCNPESICTTKPRRAKKRSTPKQTTNLPALCTKPLSCAIPSTGTRPAPFRAEGFCKLEGFLRRRPSNLKGTIKIKKGISYRGADGASMILPTLPSIDRRNRILGYSSLVMVPQKNLNYCGRFLLLWEIFKNCGV